MKKVLFVCSRNRLRSPTAEQVFATRSDIEVLSAGLDNDAETVLTADLVAWADVIFVMERKHQTKLRGRFKSSLKSARVICLGIPDRYKFMEPELIRLLETKVPPHLQRG